MIKSKDMYNPQSSAPMQNSFGNRPAQNPYQQQSSQPQQNQQQASPFSAPDMSAYAKRESPYNSSNVPRSAPKGAQVNDLSGNVPSNQIYAQAYNQAAQQSGTPNRYTSFTQPGTYTSQGYNPQTGVYGPQTGGASNDGNMAYNAIDNRPGPMTATSSFNGGKPMGIQETFDQRMAFAGNLSDRLNQYTGGQATGQVTIDPQQLTRQANDQIAAGQWVSPPLQQYDPAVQGAMNNSSQFFQGSQPFQNPLGGNEYNNPTPSWGQQSYDPRPTNYPGGNQSTSLGQFGQQRPVANPAGASPAQRPSQAPSQPTTQVATNIGGRPINYDGNQAPARDQSNLTMAPQGSPSPRSPSAWTDADIEEANRQRSRFPDSARVYRDESGNVMEIGGYGRQGDVDRPRPVAGSPPKRREPAPPPATPSSARPIAPSPTGDAYDPATAAPSLPPVPPQRAPARPTRPNYTNMVPGQDFDIATGEIKTKLTQPELAARRIQEQEQKAINELRSQGTDTPANIASVREHFQAMQRGGSPGGSGQSSAGQSDQARTAQLSKIDNEIEKWKQATYGTRSGGGPPAEWTSHIQALQRLRAKAAKGDPAAMAWNPKMQAPPPNRGIGAGESMGFKNKRYTQEAGNARVRS